MILNTLRALLDFYHTVLTKETSVIIDNVVTLYHDF